MNFAVMLYVSLVRAGCARPHPRLVRFIPRFVRFVARRWRRAEPLANLLPSKARTHQAKGTSSNRRESEMNVLKHMETLFLVAALAVVGTTYASAESYKSQVRADAMVSVGSEKMATVKVVAKRLPAATKFA